MAYLKDLSDYTFSPPEADQPKMKSIGFLQPDKTFDVHQPTEEVLDLLWQHCKISVNETRGIHRCEFCQAPPKTVYASRKDSQGLIRLGGAEILVFSAEGEIYAAPNLVYHYVHVHHYNPPDEFLEALIYGPSPANPLYFGHLRRTKFQWKETHFSEIFPVLGVENIDGVLHRYEMRDSTYLDQS
jgi:hypothetical protein